MINSNYSRVTPELKPGEITRVRLCSCGKQATRRAFISDRGRFYLCESCYRLATQQGGEHGRQ